MRYEGFSSLAWRILVKCLSPLGVLEVAFLYEIDLTRPVPYIPAKVPATFARATASDIEPLAAVVVESGDAGTDHVPSVVQKLQARFERGEICFLARIGPRIVHYNWISFRWKESLAGRFIVLDDDAAYCGGAYTVGDWRGQAIHTEVNSRMVRFLQENGFRRAYTFAHSDNRSSRKTLHRMGWKRSGAMLAFTPRRQRRARIWRLTGRLDPFIGERIPQ